MPGRMDNEDWARQRDMTMTPEERDLAASTDLAREEALGRLASELNRTRRAAGLDTGQLAAISLADAAGETYRRVREEGRTPPEEIVTVRGLSDELSGPGAAAEPAARPSPRPRLLPFEETQYRSNTRHTTECLERGEEQTGNCNGECAMEDLPPNTHDPETGKALQKWADVAMWKAPEHADPQKPVVLITVAPEDPLGIMAMVNGMYTGKVYRSPAEVSDAERREAWEAGAVSLLSLAPLEWFQVSILFENVTRAFTHQLVRQRMAGYAQESQRFAVKGDAGDSVKLPPSLSGTVTREEFDREMEETGVNPDFNRRKEQEWRELWDDTVEAIGRNYEALVNAGMPAEDARGLLPTNILTRIHEHVDMGTLLKMAGTRLCTQAQFEWRAVFAQLVQSLRTYLPADHPNAWQYELIAERFRPVCFAANKCTMKAKSDRHCSIREQVDALEAAGIKSDRWETPDTDSGGRQWITIKGARGTLDHTVVTPVHPSQWLADPTAARVAP